MNQKKREALIGRITQEYRISEEAAKKQADDILRLLPKELAVNLDEWLQGRELTDVHIRGYSIPMLFHIWDCRDFLRAVRVMAELRTDRDMAERRIWQMRG